MDRKDRSILALIFAVIGVVAYYYSYDFYNISSETISLISLALAIYSIALTALSGNSELAIKMRKTVDPNSNGERTHIGTINLYIKRAFFFGFATIIVAATSLILHDERWLRKLYLMTWGNRMLGLRSSYRIFSSLCFALFGCNFFFMHKIITLILNRITYNS